MTLLYNFGLTTGSLMAYLLESMLSPVEQYTCPQDLAYNKISQRVVENATLNATLLSTAKTTVLSTIVPSVASAISNAVGNSTLESNNR